MWLQVFLGLLLLLLIVSIIVLSSVPPVSRDALTHHLVIPKLYLEKGAIYQIPEILFSYYPMNLELLYIIPLYFGNDIVPKFIHLGFGLLTAALIFSYLVKRLNAFYALLGALFFLSLPVIIRLSITVYVDLGLVFFSTASLYYLLQWVESGFSVRKLLLSAFFCGLALGTKYNALVVAVLLSLFIPFIYAQKKGGGLSSTGKSLGVCGLYLSVALIVFSPWMVRNYLWTKNPIYPIYHSWFKGSEKIFNFKGVRSKSTTEQPKAIQSKRPATTSLGLFTYRRIAYQESWPEILTVPIRVFFQGKDDDPKYFDGRLNPFIFFLPFLGFMGIGRDTPMIRMEKKVFASFAVLFLIVTFFQVEMRVRYIAPILPPLVILSIFGLHRIGEYLMQRSKMFSVATIAAIGIVFMGQNLLYLAGQFERVDPIPYIRGHINRHEYIERHRREYPVFRFINSNLPNEAVILRFFIGNRIYYCNRKTLSGTKIFHRAVKRADTPEQVVGSLKNMGFTHLIIRADLFNEWLDNNFNDAEKLRILSFFQAHTRQLYHKSGYVLYQL